MDGDAEDEGKDAGSAKRKRRKKTKPGRFRWNGTNQNLNPCGHFELVAVVLLNTIQLDAIGDGLLLVLLAARAITRS